MPPDMLERLLAERDGIVTAVLSAAGEEGLRRAALLRSLVDGVLDAVLHADRDEGALRGVGAGLAAGRVPLATALGWVQLAAVTASQRWWAVSTPEDVDVMFAVARDWEPAVERARAALSAGFYDRLTTHDAVAAARDDLLVEMLSGRVPAPVLVRAAGVRLAAHYAVLCGTPPADWRVTPDWETRLQGIAGSADVLVRARAGRLVVLVPAPEIADPHRRAAARELFAAVAECTPLRAAAVAFAAREALPTAVGRAAHLDGSAATSGATGVLLVGAEDRRAGPGRRADTAAGEWLRALAPDPVLLQTLVELYDHDLDPARTARALGIDRRVLVRRLQHVRDLVGVDPLSRTGRRRLLGALALRSTSSRPA